MLLKCKMVDANYESIVSCVTFVLITIVCILSHQVVEGRHDVVEKYSDKPKGTLKTIVSEDRDVIDCVDFYKQPAFEDPLIKNNIQMMPSAYPSEIQSNSTQPEVTQLWHKSGQCPQGTVPIRRRTQKHENHKYHSHRIIQPNQTNSESSHLYSTVAVRNGQYYHGAHASINVWNPKTDDQIGSFSVSQIWVAQDLTEDINTIEVGWAVLPHRYQDTRTRFFIYWTRDGYRNTGCYDLDCAGFVQTNRKFALGSAIRPISTYGGRQFDTSINVYKDKKSGNWWLQLQGIALGYWPSTIFTTLADSASIIVWGGEIYDPSPSSPSTSQMGSGHFPYEGYGKSSFFRNLKAIDKSDTQRDPVNLAPLVTAPEYYGLHLMPNARSTYGTYFYYGGPGFSPKSH